VGDLTNINRTGLGDAQIATGAVVAAKLGTGAVETAKLADDAVTSAKLAETTIQYAEVSITNAEMLALRAAPKTLVAAPGAGKVIQFLGALLFFDYTAAYTESTDNLAIRYTDGSGTIVSQAIEAGGFVDATADTMTACDNAVLVLHNTGDGELGGGNAANSVRVRVAYRIVPAGW
jgi:hypothetical protein